MKKSITALLSFNGFPIVIFLLTFSCAAKKAARRPGVICIISRSNTVAAKRTIYITLFYRKNFFDKCIYYVYTYIR